MVTVLAIYDTQTGKCIVRCDARCYKGTTKKCRCVCGGKNHGIGFENATVQAKNKADQWVRKYAREQGLKLKDIRYETHKIEQLTFFELERPKCFVCHKTHLAEDFVPDEGMCKSCAEKTTKS